MSDEASFLFAANDRPIGMILEVIGPTNANSFPTRGEERSFESVPFGKAIEFPSHGRVPGRTIRTERCFMIGVGRFREVPGPVVEEGRRSRKKTVMEEVGIGRWNVRGGGRGNFVYASEGYEKINRVDIVIVPGGFGK